VPKPMRAMVSFSSGSAIVIIFSLSRSWCWNVVVRMMGRLLRLNVVMWRRGERHPRLRRVITLGHNLLTKLLLFSIIVSDYYPYRTIIIFRLQLYSMSSIFKAKQQSF
jgi:hypothetical protein